MHRCDQYRLPLSDAEKQKVLAAAINKGSSAGTHEMYNTFSRNCVSEVVQAIDEGSGRRTSLLSKLTPTILPNAIPIYLQERGLLSAPAPTLAQEMGLPEAS